MRAFGPVPSRRLGRSLGVNNVPAKTCSYSCVYCQLGCGFGLTTERQPFYDPQELAAEVRERVSRAVDSGERIDYITFVPDGEPTLDRNLGATLRALRPLGVKTAVITNASLLWSPEVREDLNEADLVSIKVDSVDEVTWHRMNRPDRTLGLDRVLGGIREFSRSYKGEILSETMLVQGLNCDELSLEEVGEYLASIGPVRAYLTIPTRPPAEKWVLPPTGDEINGAYQIMSRYLRNLECLIGYEGDAFASTGDPSEDFLSIISVHPMRRSAVDDYLSKAQEPWEMVADLIERGEVLEVEYRGEKYYVRNLRGRSLGR